MLYHAQAAHYICVLSQQKMSDYLSCHRSSEPQTPSHYTALAYVPKRAPLALAEKRSSAIQLNKGALTPAKKSSSIGSNAKDCSVYTILPITTHSGPPYVQSKSCTYLWQPNHAVLTTFKLNLYVCRMGHFPLLVQSIIQLNKKVLTAWAQNDPNYENATTILKTHCKVHLVSYIFGHDCRGVQAIASFPRYRDSKWAV